MVHTPAATVPSPLGKPIANKERTAVRSFFLISFFLLTVAHGGNGDAGEDDARLGAGDLVCRIVVALGVAADDAGIGKQSDNDLGNPLAGHRSVRVSFEAYPLREIDALLP